MRPLLAVVAAAAASALAAVIMGEYDLAGVGALVASALFGVAVAEVAHTVAREPLPNVAVAAVTLVAGAGLVWAAWISTGHRLDLARTVTWFGVGLGVLAAATWLRTGRGRARRSALE